MTFISKKAELLGVKAREQETQQGLAFVPTIVPNDDNADWTTVFLGPRVRPSLHLTDATASVLRSEFLKRSQEIKGGILEIGVQRIGEKNETSTNIFTTLKRQDTVYLGVDITDKSVLQNQEKNVYTIMCNSFDQVTIRKKLHDLNVEKISVLMIDGWHSVNAVINDWKYTDMLTDDGIVVFHDTNFHPGPIAVVEAIDRQVYDVVKFCEDVADDYGLSIAFRKQK